MKWARLRYTSTARELQTLLDTRGMRLSKSSRRTPIFMAAGIGAGKSRFLGRLLAWQDFYNGVPLVILDPHGVTIDNFLDKLSRLSAVVPEGDRQKLWQRIRYVDMSGQSGYVTPFPLYYRLGNESLYTVAQRHIDVIGKLDPYLHTASIEGFSALKRVGTNVGMLLAAMECQVTEANSLLRSPEVWVERARRLDKHEDELAPVLAFFTKHAELADGPRNRQQASYANKIDQFELDKTMRAMFGPNQAGIDWPQVVDSRLAVLLDFRHVHDSERRQFLMMWAYQYFLSFAKFRGPGRHQAVSLIVDELAALFPAPGLVADQFAADLDEMVNQVARNYSLWVTLATQELYQFSERLQKTLLSMTLIQGRTSDPEAAVLLAQRLNRYEPYKVKKWDNVWMSDMLGPYIVEKRPVEFTADEQQLLSSYDFLDLPKFEFLVRAPRSEGDMSGDIRRVSIEGLDRGHFPDEELVAKSRALLARRDGLEQEAVLAELNARVHPGAERQVKGAPSAKKRLPATSSRTSRGKQEGAHSESNQAEVPGVGYSHME